MRKKSSLSKVINSGGIDHIGLSSGYGTTNNLQQNDLTKNNIFAGSQEAKKYPNLDIISEENRTESWASS